MASAFQLNGRRVALFMPYGYLPISTSVLNTARAWAAHGVDVEVFARTSDAFEMPALETSAISVHSVEVSHKARLKPLAFAYSAMRDANRRPYMCAVGFDQGGLLAAAGVALRDRCPYVYHSLEILLRDQVHGARARLVRAMEVPCARHAALVVTQDAPRAQLLIDDLGLRSDRLSIVPNTPFGAFAGERSHYLRDKFGMPRDVRVVLLSGSLIPEHLALDVIGSVRDWPAGFVLAVHGWAPDPTYEAAIREAAARLPGRIYLSFDVLPMDRVDELYSSADIGLAVYRPVDRNYVNIGAAAGKVFGYMRVGTPTIASDLPGLNEIVERTGSGAVVQDVREIPERLVQISARFEEYSKAASKAFLRYEFSRHYARVIARLSDLSGVDLRQRTGQR